MKRALTALLAILYLSLASGMTVHAHYCMGKMIGASLAHAGMEDDSEHTCGLCGMKKSSDDGSCCHDEEESFKVSEAQKGAMNAPALLALATALPARISYPVAQSSLPTRDTAANLWANAPPPRPPAMPIFLRVRNFRI